MTGLEDFLAEHDRPVRTVVVPGYFGLAIVVEEERLRRQPALAAELDRIEGPAGSRTLLELVERLRVGAMAHHHTVVRQHTDRYRRLADRYLDRIVDDLAGGDAARRTGLVTARRALGDLESAGRSGRVAVVGGDVGVAALVCAQVDAVGPGRGVLVVGSSTTDSALRSVLARLDLDVEVDVVTTWDAASAVGIALVLDTSAPSTDTHHLGGPEVVRITASGPASQH